MLSAFSQGFSMFLLCRLGASIGISGAVPASFSLYSEFLPREKRAEHLSWLCLSWIVGGVYAAALAWQVIPNSGWGFQVSILCANESSLFSLGTNFMLGEFSSFCVLCHRFVL